MERNTYEQQKFGARITAQHQLENAARILAGAISQTHSGCVDFAAESVKNTRKLLKAAVRMLSKSWDGMGQS